MDYSPHGNSTIYWQSSYLVLELDGGFNLEGVQVVNEKIKSFVKEYSFDSWCLVIKLAPNTLLTADSIKEVSNVMAWIDRHNCHCVAYVTTNSHYEKLLENFFQNIDLQYKILSSKDAAFDWFKLAKIDQ